MKYLSALVLLISSIPASAQIIDFDSIPTMDTTQGRDCVTHLIVPATYGFPANLACVDEWIKVYPTDFDMKCFEGTQIYTLKEDPSFWLMEFDEHRNPVKCMSM